MTREMPATEREPEPRTFVIGDWDFVIDSPFAIGHSTFCDAPRVAYSSPRQIRLAITVASSASKTWRKHSSKNTSAVGANSSSPAR